MFRIAYITLGGDIHHVIVAAANSTTALRIARAVCGGFYHSLEN